MTIDADEAKRIITLLKPHGYRTEGGYIFTTGSGLPFLNLGMGQHHAALANFLEDRARDTAKQQDISWHHDGRGITILCRGEVWRMDIATGFGPNGPSKKSADGPDIHEATNALWLHVFDLPDPRKQGTA